MNNFNLYEECLKKEVIFEGKIIKLEKDTVKLPNGNTTTREVVRHPGAVGIIAVKEGNLILVRQYRYALGKETLEIPAGKIDEKEKPEKCAVRELREETGYSGEMMLLGAYNTSPGFADEIVYLYLACSLQWDPLKADEDEFLGVTSVPWEKAIEMVYNGEIQDAKTALGILLASRMIQFGLC